MNENDLEKLIDSTSLSEVLAMLANICYEKAQHIETNWQDDLTASAWYEAVDHINNAIVEIDV